MHEKQRVAEMMEEVLGRQAIARIERTGVPLELLRGYPHPCLPASSLLLQMGMFYLAILMSPDGTVSR